jgi:hypothetical protein
MKTKIYEPVEKTPVAKFFYKGTHSRPIRRTVIVIKETRKIIVGYELREGNVLRSTKDAKNHIKSYLKSKIAKKKPELAKTTLKRLPLSAIFNG